MYANQKKTNTRYVHEVRSPRPTSPLLTLRRSPLLHRVFYAYPKNVYTSQYGFLANRKLCTLGYQVTDNSHKSSQSTYTSYILKCWSSHIDSLKCSELSPLTRPLTSLLSVSTLSSPHTPLGVQVYYKVNFTN